ncbi:MAG: hypothetical protein ACOCV1_04765 [Bacillota bacterium]
MKNNYTLIGRFSENNSSKKDLKFINKKLKGGMSKAELVRNAIKTYRKFEEKEITIIEEELKKISQKLDDIDKIKTESNSNDTVRKEVDNLKNNLNNIMENGL